MWRNWNPLNPPINNVSSEEEEHNNYESADDDPEQLVSPNRPHQSPTASPRALLRPDPPSVDEVLREAGQRLTLPDRQQRAANRNAVRRAQEAAAAAAVGPARPANEVVNMVDFDAENGVDGDKAQEHARSIRVNSINPK